MSRTHYSDYDQDTTTRCERALLTQLGDIGPWRERIFLAGGLAPRYLVGVLPAGEPAHVGTADVDVIIGLALADEAPETYRTLQNNLEKASFRLLEPSFRWARDVDGAQLARHDHVECQITGERLDGGGHSAVTLRVANVLPYTVLKIFAFQDRHDNKDAYDLV